MSFDRDGMLAGPLPVARVVLASVRGSSPRDMGTSMLVWQDGTAGTIGGGTLELQAIESARKVLVDGAPRVHRQALGPALGQCCGGAVVTLIERWDQGALESIAETVVRPFPGTTNDCPPGLNADFLQKPLFRDGWFAEPLVKTTRAVWIWGAGHVGRALVDVLTPFPEYRIFWADTDAARFPQNIAENVETLVAQNPADLVRLASPDAEHYVMTYSHAFDLEICNRVLTTEFRSLGLIGSETKGARFRSRLKALGHSAAKIDRMICPIGDKSLGKHPQAIALGVVTGILRAEAVGVTSWIRLRDDASS